MKDYAWLAVGALMIGFVIGATINVQLTEEKRIYIAPDPHSFEEMWEAEGKRCKEWGGYFMVNNYQRDMEGNDIHNAYCWKESREELFRYEARI